MGFSSVIYLEAEFLGNKADVYVTFSENEFLK